MIRNWNGPNSWATRAGQISSRLTPKDFFPKTIQTARDVATSLRGLNARDFQSHAQKLRRFSKLKSLQEDESLLALVTGTVCEAVQRVLGFELFDEQLLAGAAVSTGATVEMQTGEGKTPSLGPFLLAITRCPDVLSML